MPLQIGQSFLVGIALVLGVLLLVTVCFLCEPSLFATAG